MAADPEKIRELQAALEAYEAGEGQPLIDPELEHARAKVRERALRLLDQRSRSRHELRERLIGNTRGVNAAEGFEPELVDDVLDAFERAGLIDDELFACEWVRQRFERRGKSSAVLDLELKRKGVGDAARAVALEQISDDDEAELGLSLARKKARSITSVPEDRLQRDKELRKIVGVLARRGFGEAVALSVGRRALDERCELLEQEGVPDES